MHILSPVTDKLSLLNQRKESGGEGGGGQASDFLSKKQDVDMLIATPQLLDTAPVDMVRDLTRNLIPKCRAYLLILCREWKLLPSYFLALDANG